MTASFFCTGFTLREDFSGASSSVITVPTGSAAATFAGGGGGYSPGENVVDFFGYAAADVAHVVVTTPDGLEHLAALDGNVWWAAPVVDESVASRAGEGTWRALDRDGVLIADGRTERG